MSFNIEVEGGSSVRLPTAGKYVDRDIVIKAGAQPDWNAEEGEPGHILNRPFAKIPPRYEVLWDGSLSDRILIDLSPLGLEYVSLVHVSDKVYAQEELIGKYYTMRYGDNYVEITASMIQSLLPGSFSVDDGGITVVYSAEEVCTAMGAPADYVANGTYFMYDHQSNDFINSIVSTPGYVQKMDKECMPDLSSLAIIRIDAAVNLQDGAWHYLPYALEDMTFHRENAIRHGFVCLEQFETLKATIPICYEQESGMVFGKGLFECRSVQSMDYELYEVIVVLDYDNLRLLLRPTGITFTR